MLYWIQGLAMAAWAVVASLMTVVLMPFYFGSPKLNQIFGRLLAFGLLPLARIRVEFENREIIHGGNCCIYVANHQHLLDVAFYGNLCPENVVVVAKKEIKRIPFVGLAFQACGTLFVDRQNREAAVRQLNEALHKVKSRGWSIALMPEGTRNRKMEGILPFKKGAFHLAIRGQMPLIMVVASDASKVIRGHGLLGRELGGVVRVRVLPPISTIGMTEKDVDRLTETAYNLMQKAQKEISI